MFIAMNRFKVIRGAETSFKEVWTRRDTQLSDVPGFLSFHLLRGPEREDHTLYSSHTSWRRKRCCGLIDDGTTSPPTTRPALGYAG